MIKTNNSSNHSGSGTYLSTAQTRTLKPPPLFTLGFFEKFIIATQPTAPLPEKTRILVSGSLKPGELSGSTTHTDATTWWQNKSQPSNRPPQFPPTNPEALSYKMQLGAPLEGLKSPNKKPSKKQTYHGHEHPALSPQTPNPDSAAYPRSSEYRPLPLPLPLPP